MDLFRCACECGCELLIEVNSVKLKSYTGFFERLFNKLISISPKPVGFKCAGCGKILLNTKDFTLTKVDTK